MDNCSLIREEIKEIEAKIITIIGGDVEYNFVWTQSKTKREQIERLIWHRKNLLDKMFIATPEEISRFEQVNSQLLSLTKKMYERTANLYRKMATTTYDADFDDDVIVEGTLKFSMNERASILPMTNDDYYGSDFYSMLSVIDWLYSCSATKFEYVEFCCCNIFPPNYSPDMSNKELGLVDELNDRTSWYSHTQPASDKLKNITVCHAIHNLSNNKPYSIPDILRMNDFWVEVMIKHQHIVDQDGSRMKREEG